MSFWDKCPLSLLRVDSSHTSFIFPYGRELSLTFWGDPPPPSSVDASPPRTGVPLTQALNRFPRLTRSGQMASPEWGIRANQQPAAQEAGVSGVL